MGTWLKQKSNSEMNPIKENFTKFMVTGPGQDMKVVRYDARTEPNDIPEVQQMLKEKSLKDEQDLKAAEEAAAKAKEEAAAKAKEADEASKKAEANAANVTAPG